MSPLLCFIGFLSAAPLLQAQEFRSAWPDDIVRPWAGPDYWANPLQDWRIQRGRLECHVAGGDRNVFLLTRELAAHSGDLDMSVRLGRLETDKEPMQEGFVGFRVGIRGRFRDYRDSAVRGDGLNLGVASDGRLFIGAPDDRAPRFTAPLDGLELRVRGYPSGGGYRLELEARDVKTAVTARLVREGVPERWLAGGLALVCSSGKIASSPPPEASLEAGFGQKRGTERGGTLRFWFRDWRVSGSKVEAHEERSFGPMLFALHTLSRRVLKISAQLAPVDDPDLGVAFQVRAPGSEIWRTMARERVDPLSRTATFRISDWNDTRDTPYRLVCSLAAGGRPARDYSYEGTIRSDPRDKPQIVVAAFTGNNDLGFPHADVVKNVAHFKPDLLFFTGDNIYERVGEYGIQRQPVATAALDYLRKWYLFGWEYRDLLKDIPSVSLPDDHDVYHGNLWGAGGRHAEGTGYEGQDKGGYTMPAEWVNMVQRTQTSHLPDPHDPSTVEQGITVYFTHLLYGGLSVAVIEDRKWKSAPKDFLQQAQIINGWAQNPKYDAAKEADAPGAQLLGERQLRFLNGWAADWSGGAWMKAVVSQTIFANVATLPLGTRTDAVVSTLRILKPGEYEENDSPVADHDSNGWPQSGRNEALRAMRRALAVHIAGDQHLGSTIQYGIDDWNDAAWAICVPSVANIFPRRWYPPRAGRNRKRGSPRYTGEFLDGFGNKMTVHAVSNPTATGAQPVALHDRAPGYGIITFDRATRRVTFANWPRWVDAAAPNAKPYPGWPITISQAENGLPKSGWKLPEVQERNIKDPVVQVIDQSNNEIVYTLRIQGTSFTPAVFRDGVYTVTVTDPDRGLEKVYRDLKPSR